MSAEKLCKLRSNEMLNTTRRQTLQSSNKHVSYMSYSWKQIMKGSNFFMRIFSRLAPTLLKYWYLITIIWYARLAPTRRQCFIACECVSSQPNKPYLIYESRHKNGLLIGKWASNMTIGMLERENVSTDSQFPTPKKVMQRHPIHPKLQYSSIYLLRNCGTR